jgi:putative membrane protein
MGVLSFVRYKKVERQIDDNTYRPSAILSIMLFLSVLAIGAFLVLYLVHSM